MDSYKMAISQLAAESTVLGETRPGGADASVSDFALMPLWYLYGERVSRG